MRGEPDQTKRLETTTAGLSDVLRGIDEPFSVLLLAGGRDDSRQLDTTVRHHVEQLARCCVGIAVVSADAELRAAVLRRSGRLPFPLTALADGTAAAGWLSGQEAVGMEGVRPAGGSRILNASPQLADYITDHLNPPPDPLVATLTERTIARFGSAGMNVGEDQGRLLKLLVESLGARTVIEVGTFTGMSALWIARGLPADGTLTCLELDDERIEVARTVWKEAEVDDRIEVLIGPALESLQSLPPGTRVDFAFIDADKESYLAYVDALLPLLAPRGIIAVDNTLWSGAVVDSRVTDGMTVAIRAFNDELAARPDLEVTPLTVGDGLTLVRRR